MKAKRKRYSGKYKNKLILTQFTLFVDFIFLVNVFVMHEFM